MEINGKIIDCDTPLSDVLDSKKYLPNDQSTNIGDCCKTVKNRLNSKISTFSELIEGSDSPMSLALVIDGVPQGYSELCGAISNYESASTYFNNEVSTIELKIVERELDELKELSKCLKEKCLSYKDALDADDNPELKSYDAKWKEVDDRFSKIKSFYYTLPGASYTYSRSKLAEAKANKAKDSDYEVSKYDYLEMVNSNWYSSLLVISGKTPEELGVSPRDRVIFDSALETFKKHFEGQTPTPAEMVIYWDNIKAGTTEDYTFGDDERQRVSNVANIISGIDDQLYGFSFDISVWARCNGMPVDEDAYDDFIKSKVTNTPYYYRTALEETKFNI